MTADWKDIIELARKEMNFYRIHLCTTIQYRSLVMNTWKKPGSQAPSPPSIRNTLKQPKNLTVSGQKTCPVAEGP